MLREFIAEVVKASPSYMKKEELRQTIQDILVNRVNEGTIKNQKDVDSFFADVEMATRALKGVPFDVLKQIAAKG